MRSAKFFGVGYDCLTCSVCAGSCPDCSCSFSADDTDEQAEISVSWSLPVLFGIKKKRNKNEMEN